MDNRQSIQAIKASIKSAAEAFFSPGSLQHKIAQASALYEMPGHTLFQTPLPWVIQLPDGLAITGHSESLVLAAKDILAQLTVLQKTASSNIEISLEIDEPRLLAQVGYVKVAG